MTPLELAREVLAKMERDAERQWQAAGQRGVETSVTNFLTESQARAKTDRLRAEGFTVNEPRNLPYDKAGEMKVIRTTIAECDRLAAENADIRAQAGGMDMDITELRVQLHGFRLTLDNERGLGAPPSARWYAVAGGGWAAATGHVAHCAPGEWHWRDSGAGGISPTARDAMKAADKVAK